MKLNVSSREELLHYINRLKEIGIDDFDGQKILRADELLKSFIPLQKVIIMHLLA
jgi:hypothetical protein